MKIFSGNSNISLATEVAGILEVDIGRAQVGKFSDGEIQVEIQENVRGQRVFVVQSTSAPTNDNLMEMLVMIDALRRSAAKEIIAVVPYFGYARQDRRPGYSRTPITAKLIANMLEAAGVDQIVTIDIHSLQQQGFFDIPMINISSAPDMISDILEQNKTQNKRLVVVSPDVGGVARARYVAKLLDNCDLAIIDKRREEANSSTVMNIIGDVQDAHCVMIDDMIDTAGTLCNAAAALKQDGKAASIMAYATHPVFSGNAYKNITGSELDQVVVTNTIHLEPNELEYYGGRVRVLSCGPLLARSISRIDTNRSISSMYLT